jgi:GT2 family glycosyltransferase
MRSVTIVKSKGEIGDGLNYNIEGLKQIGNLLIVHGWVVDPMRRLCMMSVNIPGFQKNIDLRSGWIRFDRPDVRAAFRAPQASLATHYGFVAVVGDVPDAARLERLGIAVVSSSGRLHVEGVPVASLPCAVESLPILAGIFTNSQLNVEQCERFYEPIFREISSRTLKPVEFLDMTLGFEAKDCLPDLSVIIPLYGQTRFEVTQIPALAALAVPGWEIILAVDDPRITSAVLENAERLTELYGIRVRVLAVAENLGFSGINNFAAQRARGRHVLFLNSDCFVAKRDLIERARAWLEATPDAGAVGFRLLYADRSIQHDGMSVSKWNGDNHFLLNDHPRMGVPVNMVQTHHEGDQACMLTAACLLMSREQFLSVGGFDQVYLRGDFEDSDLCLKLVSRGLKLGIVRDEGIFHLERQSISEQESGIRQKITLVNSFIYTRKWREVLSAGLNPLEVIA